MKLNNLLLITSFISLILDQVNCICQSPCATCLSGSDTQCTSCEKTNKIVINYQCVECEYPCATCSGSITSCQSCLPGYYLSNDKCLKCDDSCTECQGSSTYCTLCAKITQYSSNGICYNCVSPCVSCEQDNNLCKSCINSFELNGQSCQQTINAGNCSANCTSCTQSQSSTACTGCQDGYYLSQNKSCLKCDLGIKTCHLTSYTALSCQKGYIQVGNTCSIDQNNPPVCDTSCKTCTLDQNIDGCSSCFENAVLIGQNGIGRCQKCESPCFGCSQDTNMCTGCEKGYQLYNKTCFTCNVNCVQCEDGSNDLCKQCKDGFYLHPNKYCVQCDPTFNCLTCQNGTSCNACKIGYYKDNSTGKCVNKCDISCGTCSDTTTNCTSCNSGYYLFQGKCILCTVSSCKKCTDGKDNVCQLCNDGKYLDSSTNECKDCTSNCSSCKSKDVCDQCNTNFTIESNGMCQLVCSNPCKTCNNTPTYCTSCVKSDQIAIGGICQSCEKPCTTCEQDTNFCTNCLDGYYHVPVQRKCLPCKSPCSQCKTTEDTCTVCISGYKLNKSICEKCQNGSCFDDNIEIQTSSSLIIQFALIILITVLAI